VAVANGVRDSAAQREPVGDVEITSHEPIEAPPICGVHVAGHAG
jgi:hypothetical protein